MNDNLSLIKINKNHFTLASHVDRIDDHIVSSGQFWVPLNRFHGSNWTELDEQILKPQ